MNKREILILSICIFLTVIAWLVGDIVHTSSSQLLDADIQQAPNVKPIRLKTEVFQLLEQKK
jgi:hypothetical protein